MMKVLPSKIFITTIILYLLIVSISYGQVSIGTLSADESAVLEVSSSEKGLLIPRMDSTERANIQNPAIGLMVYQTDKLIGFYFYNGIKWEKVGTAGEDWIKEGDDLYNSNSGNIGIGTNMPSQKLHVEGNILSKTLNTGQGFNELFAMDQNLRTTDNAKFNQITTGIGLTEVYLMDQNLRTTDNVKFGQITTGIGLTEVHLMNQNVRTTDNVSFSKINTGPGLTELHRMNQNVRSIDNVTFNRIRTNSTLDVFGSAGTNTGGGTQMYEQVRIYHPDNSNYRWSIGHQFATPSSTDDDLYFYVNRNGSQNVAAFIQDANSDVQMNFTGQHRNLVKGINYNEIDIETSMEGLIVVANQNEYLKMSGGISKGSMAITINEALPVVSLSEKEKDKSVFGVISSLESEDRKDQIGAFATPYEKIKGDQRFYINSVGEGGVWIIDMGKPLESGDYIQTSSIKGYGMLQDDDVLHNYTVAKITMDCDFDPVFSPRMVVKEIRTIVNGEEHVENEIDQYGRLVWEEEKDCDGNPILESPYKLRYVNEKGEVITYHQYLELKKTGRVAYRAAFVGCTYHCG